ncbi:MAG: DUF123 domain-containing protein, partial [Dehalococcoidia bacterium]
VLQLAAAQQLTVGKLGTFPFPAGYYLYFGSALNGLESRVRRHLRPEKKRHWHIDFLASVATMRQVWWSTATDRRECVWARHSHDCPGVTVPIPRFGSSDCKCPAHLVHLPSWSQVCDLQSELASQSPLGVYIAQPSDSGFTPYYLSAG